MAASTQPIYAATPNVGSGLVPATLDASLTAPSNVTTIWTPGTNGAMLYELRTVGVGTTVAATVNVFRYDGATYHLIDQVLVTAVTSSTTAIAFKDVRTYQNSIWKNGDTLRVAVTVAGDQSMLKVTAIGADF